MNGTFLRMPSHSTSVECMHTVYWKFKELGRYVRALVILGKPEISTHQLTAATCTVAHHFCGHSDLLSFQFSLSS
jgi:hypothetical protein